MNTTNEACQENEDIDSISFISNVFDKEHVFSLDRKDLTQSTTDEYPMMPMEVINNDEEESNDENIDLRMKKMILLLKMIVMIIYYCFI